MIRDQFIVICNEAIQADQADGGMNCQILEPYFQRLIELVDTNSENKELKECFREVIWGRIKAPYETLEYCMRALRYVEIAEESQRRLGDPPDPRWMNAHSHILHALHDDVWEEAEMWRLQK